MDTFNYVVSGNPYSQAFLGTIGNLASGTANILGVKSTVQKEVIALPSLSLWELCGKNVCFIRLAGINGAIAMIMGAYGKHNLSKIQDPKEQNEAKIIFDTANRYHFIHCCALLAIPLAKRPYLTGVLMATGSALFSGTMYYRALTGDKTFVHVATCGGFCLLASWLSLIF